MTNKILGYKWEDIQRAQQGGRLSKIVKERRASVQCFRCEKYFPLPKIKENEDPYPMQCLQEFPELKPTIIKPL